MSLSNVKKTVWATLLASMAITAFAEDAPVYEVDNYPPSFDGQSDSGSEGVPNSPPMMQQAPAVSEQQAQPQMAVSPPPAVSMPSSLTLEQRMGRVEQQIINLQHSDSSARLDSLQAEVQSMRGQLDDLTHQLQQLQTQQQAMYADLDKRIRERPAASAVSSSSVDNNAPAATATKSSTPLPHSKTSSQKASVSAEPDIAAAATATTATQPNVAEEQQIYQSAYDYIKANKYNDAINALQKMLQKYPSGQFAANAHFWLGELYGLQGQNAQSAAEFTTVVTRYPNSPKVSDAQLRLGMIYAAEFKWSDAKLAFKKVINRYPGTASARLASEQLKQIKLAGH